MKEHNKKTLIEALSSLREYDPPEELWEKIEAETEVGKDEIFPANLLQSLPVYDPPETVWAGIEKELHRKPTGRLVRFGWRRAVAVAASMAFLVVAFWKMGNNTTTVPPDHVDLSFSTETVDPMLLARDWDEDEEVFREYLQFCEAKKFICEQPEFKLLQAELEELTTAKEDLVAAVGAFGTDPALIIQLKEIELERTGILKKMMVMLI